MSQSINEQMLDSIVGHQAGLQLYSNAVVRRMLSLLNRSDRDLVAQLEMALIAMPASAYSVERLNQLLTAVRTLNAQAYLALGRELTSEMLALVSHEVEFQQELFETVIPPQVVARIGLASISAEQVHAAAMARPFQGRLLSAWPSSLATDRATRIRDAVRMGYIEGQTVSQIVQRVRGSKANGYSDGVISIDRHHAEAVVRTAIGHTAAFARDRFYEENDDLIKAVVWTSTLDSRTSPICQARDGKKYSNAAHRPIGHALPWLGGPGRAHWQCRSVSVPVTKSFRELGIDIDELPPGTRASMDGQVPADLTYGAWLKKQSAARQDEVLGATRGALFRRGGLPIEKFVNNKGKVLTLDELRKQDRRAFESAGLTAPSGKPREPIAS